MARTMFVEEAKPKFYDDVYLVPLGEDEIQLRAGAKTFKLSGRNATRLLKTILPRLSGERSFAELLAQAKDEERDPLASLVSLLMKHRILHDARDEDDATSSALSSEEFARHSAQLRFLSHFTQNRFETQVQLRNSTVCVLGAGRLGAALISALRDVGIGAMVVVDTGVVEDDDIGACYRPEQRGQNRLRVLSDQWAADAFTTLHPVETDVDEAADLTDAVSKADIVVACCEEPTVRMLEAVNRACVDNATPWMRCMLDGYRALLGPTVIPAETACYHCYLLRERSNANNIVEHLSFERWLEDNPKHRVRYGSLAPFESILAGYATLETVRLLTNITALDATTIGHLMVVNLLTYETEVHRVLRIPRCSVCGLTRGRESMKAWSD